MNKKIERQKGISQLLLIVFMGILAIALPVSTRLVQKSQENRSSAAPVLCVAGNLGKTKCDGNYTTTCITESTSNGLGRYTWKKASSPCTYGCERISGKCNSSAPAPTATPTPRGDECSPKGDTECRGLVFYKCLYSVYKGHNVWEKSIGKCPSVTPTSTPAPTRSTCSSKGGVCMIMAYAPANGVRCVTGGKEGKLNLSYSCEKANEACCASLTSIDDGDKDDDEDKINGKCGSANGKTFTSIPTSNLCSAGRSYGNQNSLKGSTYSWGCLGIDGGNSVGCKATISNRWVIEGACNKSTGLWSCTELNAEQASGKTTYSTKSNCQNADGCNKSGGDTLITITTPSVTPVPATPTPGSGDGSLTFRVTFAGLVPDRSCLDGFKEVELTVGKKGEDISQDFIVDDLEIVEGETNDNGLQVFEGKVASLNTNISGNVYMKIKGSMHGKMLYCKNGQSGRYLGQVCDLSLGGAVNDFTEYPILAGDINQDGVINSIDFAIAKGNSGTLLEECNQGGDLNGDSKVNNLDLQLIKQALSYKDDD